MAERVDSSAEYPWNTDSSSRQGSLVEARAVELDQAVRDLQDLARGRLSAPPQQRRRRRNKSRS